MPCRGRCCRPSRRIRSRPPPLLRPSARGRDAACSPACSAADPAPVRRAGGEPPAPAPRARLRSYAACRSLPSIFAHHSFSSTSAGAGLGPLGQRGMPRRCSASCRSTAWRSICSRSCCAAISLARSLGRLSPRSGSCRTDSSRLLRLPRPSSMVLDMRRFSFTRDGTRTPQSVDSWSSAAACGSIPRTSASAAPPAPQGRQSSALLAAPIDWSVNPLRQVDERR